MCSEVREWLASLKLDRYYDQFIENGFDDLSSLHNLTDDDLDAVGVTLAGHRKRLIAKSNGYAGVNFTAGLTATPETPPKMSASDPEPAATIEPPSIDVSCLDEVIGELNALSGESPAAAADRSSLASKVPHDGTSDAEVDLDKLLHEMREFSPRQAAQPLPPSPSPPPPLKTEEESASMTSESVTSKDTPKEEISKIDVEEEVREQEALAATQVFVEPKAVELSGNPVVLMDPKKKQASTVEIKERLAEIKSQLDQTAMSEAEKEEHLKEARMRIAMEKMKEASHQQVVVDVYTDDGSSTAIVLQENMTASSVCFLAVTKTGRDELKHWSLIERWVDLHLERPLEDHEIALNVYLSWPRFVENRFILSEDPLKFDIFDHPARYFPAHLAMTPGETRTGTKKGERAKAIILKEFFTGSGRVPELEGNLSYKDERKTWKKSFFMLRPSGLYYSTKGKLRESKYLVCFVKFEGCSLFFGRDFKKEFKAPTDFAFALKPNGSHITHKEIRCLCAEDNESLFSWVAGIRLAIYGQHLRDNHQIAQKKAAKLKELQKQRAEDSKTPSETTSLAEVSPINKFPFEQPAPVSENNYQKDCPPPSLPPRPASNSSVSPLTPPMLPLRPQPGIRTTPRSPRFKMRPVGPHLDQPWFHGGISRDEAVTKLSKHGFSDGLFLVRESSRSDGSFVLSMIAEGKPRHFQIQPLELTPVQYSIDDGPPFPDLVQLIEHYSLTADRLPCKLTKGAARPMYRKTGE